MTMKKYVYSEVQGSFSGDTLPEGTLTYDNNELRIHDGSTAGGNVIPTDFATVASSGSYGDLLNKPENPIALFSSYSPSNDGQFLRFNADTSVIEFADNFRIVAPVGINYPDGSLTDKPGDMAFSDDGIYYCYSQPNSFDINIQSSSGYANPGWITVDVAPEPIYVGYKFTDGTTTSTVAEIVQQYNGNFGVFRIDPVVPDWYNANPSTLTVVISGETPNYGNWKKVSTAAYTPGNAAHWAAPAPATLAEAIDKIAAALYALNTNTPI